MTEVFYKKNNVNDENIQIVEIHKESGSFVEQNELILDVETSKENIEIVAPEDGYISHSLEEGMTISVGQILFIIDDDKANNQKIRNPQTVCDSCDSKEISEARFSKKSPKDSY